MNKKNTLLLALFCFFQHSITQTGWLETLAQHARRASQAVLTEQTKRVAKYAAGAVATGIGVQVYKQFIEPAVFAMPNLVKESDKNGPEILGNALSDAVKHNPAYQREPIFWGVSSAASQNESESGTSTVSQEYIEREDIVARRKDNIKKKQYKKLRKEAQAELPDGTEEELEALIDQKVEAEYTKSEHQWVPLGAGCRADTHWKQDNDCVQELDCTMYRFSIDWSRVQPEQGVWNEDQIARYAAQCEDLIDRGITPMICFHHYMDPIWFMDLGGFENADNIQYFVNFCKTMMERLGEVGVRYWLIMNQPLAYVNKGYLVSMQPPFKQDGFLSIFSKTSAVVQVRMNIFEAHRRLFKITKIMNSTMLSTEKRHKIGISHQVTPMRAHRYWSVVDPFISGIADWTYNQTFLQFARAHKSDFDFFALSFYSPCRFKLAKNQEFWDSERIGNETDDAGRIIDARGFYDAIVRVAKTVGRDKPIIFIESGLDADESCIEYRCRYKAPDVIPVGLERRINYFNQTFSALAKAIRDGYYIQGFCVWTLMDNYEWGKGFTAHFGLYSRRTATDPGTLLGGGQYYQAIIKEFNRSFAQERARL